MIDVKLCSWYKSFILLRSFNSNWKKDIVMHGEEVLGRKQAMANNLGVVCTYLLVNLDNTAPK